MAPDVPTILRATAGAIPALLIALVVQEPLRDILAQRDTQLRTGVEAIHRRRLAGSVLSGTVGVGILIISKFGKSLFLIAGVGLQSSIALQAAPTDWWSDPGAAWIVASLHFGVVALLVVVVFDCARVLISRPRSESSTSGGTTTETEDRPPA